jgi:hypothetical protein
VRVRVGECIRVNACVWVGVGARERTHVALLIQHATRMGDIVRGLFVSTTSPTLSHNRHGFQKKSY